VSLGQKRLEEFIFEGYSCSWHLSTACADKFLFRFRGWFPAAGLAQDPVPAPVGHGANRGDDDFPQWFILVLRSEPPYILPPPRYILIFTAFTAFLALFSSIHHSFFKIPFYFPSVFVYGILYPCC
jgi:hypothetical protein